MIGEHVHLIRKPNDGTPPTTWCGQAQWDEGVPEVWKDGNPGRMDATCRPCLRAEATSIEKTLLHVSFEFTTKAETVRREWMETVGERDRALAQLQLVRTAATDVWRWQGDGADAADSLSCPVVMSAATLRKMLAQIANRDALKACNDALREPMRLLRDAVAMPAEGESVVVNRVLADLASAWHVVEAARALETFTCSDLPHTDGRFDQLIVARPGMDALESAIATYDAQKRTA